MAVSAFPTNKQICIIILSSTLFSFVKIGSVKNATQTDPQAPLNLFELLSNLLTSVAKSLTCLTL